MELQMAPQVAKPIGRTTPPPHHGGGGEARPVPGYLRPAAGSCHHVCKYGGTHEFHEKETTTTATKKKKPHPKPGRKHQQQQPAVVAGPATETQSSSKVMVKVRSVFRRRVGDSSRADDKVTSAAGSGKAKGGGESVEWKDIVAYDTTTDPLRQPHGSPPQPHHKISAPVAGSGDAKKKKDVKANGADVIKSAIKPPKGRKKKKTPTSVLVEEMAVDQDLLDGYQALSPSLMQSRASLLRDLEEEMAVHGGTADAAADAEEESAKPAACCLDEEECAAVAAAETIRPIIPAHRRAKSVSIGGGGSRSVRYPTIIARQASKNSAGVTFKLRSRSTRVPEGKEEEKPAMMARLRSRRGGGEDASSGSTSTGGRGIQLRIRSLRRRGLGGGGSAGGGGFMVPAVALRHQKTLEKKKSQRLYNNVIEETASKLVKTRKSRVKALVGAFESVISKIAK